MKQRCLILFFLWMTISLQMQAQRDSSFRLLRTYHGSIAAIAVDNLDNIYLVTTTDRLKKLNAAGDSIGVYNDVKRFGKLYSIDVSNPLKLLLYYKDFSTVVVLDRLLSLRSALNLRQHQIIQTSAVGLSYDNNIWLFDEYENRLKKIDEEGNILLQTDDFRMLFPSSITPRQIIDQNNTVYLYDPTNGLYLFDHYGTFRKKIPITGWASLAITDRYISGISGNQLFFYNPSNLMQISRPLPAPALSTNSYMMANNKLFSWSKDSLQVYTTPF